MSGIPSQTRYGCYIGNIDRSVTIDMLKQVFCQCGTIIDCSLNGREGDPYRFGFIDFATEDDRARAMKYNGFTLVGRKLKVGISKGNVNKPEGFANGNPGGGGSAGHNADRTRLPGNSNGSNPNYRSGEGYGNGVVGGPNANGLTAQQQIEARLLLQFLQEGKMDPRQLSPAQQQLLIASLGQGNINTNNNGVMNSNGSNLGGMVPPQQQQPLPMGNSMMMGGMPLHQPNIPMMPTNMHMGGGHRMMMGAASMGFQGGYGNPNMMMPPHPLQQQQRSPQPWGMNMTSGNAGMYPGVGVRQLTPPQQPPQQQQMPPLQQQQQPYGASGLGVLSGGSAVCPTVNAPPSAETLRLREKQREQFFEVVRKDTERYERKLQEKKAQAAAGGGNGAAERSDSSASDNDEKPAKQSKKETSSAK